MGCFNFKKTKIFFSLTFLIILLLLISSNGFNLKAQVNQDFNLKAKGYCGFNYLEWDPVPSDNRYWIYRGIGEGNEESMPLTDFPIEDTSYKDSKNLIQGKKYCYIVKAVDKNGNEFAKSNEACAIPTCSTEIPEEKECELNLQFQIGNTFYWVNGLQKGPMLTAPIIRWDRTFLIIRHVVEEVGGTISWDGTNQIVTIITKEGKKIEFQIGNKMYKVNGSPKQIDPYNPNVVPFISNGRTLIPLRVTGDEMGAKKINWYGDKKIAELIFPVPCPEKPKGKIDVILPENCIKGTYIEVYDLKGNPITIIKENKGGLYTTDCTLPCPGSYLVKPINPNCKFFPETQTVEFREKECCPLSKRVIFEKCECEEVKNGRIVLELPSDCIKETKVVIYDSSGNVVWSGIANEKGFFDTECTLKCPGEYKVVPMNPNHIFIPESKLVSVKECCPHIESVKFECREVTQYIQKLCGCILRMTTQPDANGNYQVYVIPNCEPVQTTPYVLILNFPANLLDTNLGISILDYYNQFEHPIPSGLGCIWVVYEPTTGKVVEWAAQPDKKPCCGQVGEGGKIIVKMPKDCLDGTKVIIYDESGNEVWAGVANTDGVFDTGCTLKCPGVYKVVPLNEKCKFNPPSHVVKVDCCPRETVVEFSCDCITQNYGRIVVSMPKECLEGTVVHIINTTTNVEVWSGTANKDGVFDTDCKIPCPGIYYVRPENKNCTFYPPEDKVVMEKCCPEIYRVEFKCECAKPMGRIQVKIPKECLSGTVLYIYDSSGKLVGSFNPNLEGWFDTGCYLTCPGTYTLKPYNANCKFYPETLKVDLTKCCPDVQSYEFKCECTYKGRIDVKLPTNCLPAKVEIYDSKGTLLYRLSDTTGSGLFTTDCTLPCPGTYLVKPVGNTNCTFIPESRTVTLTQCCPAYQLVTFECSCVQTGRIIVNITGNCPSDTTVEIYNMNNVKIATLTRTAQGNYDSLCTIPCNQTVRVKPVNPKCKFDPTYKDVYLICCPQYVTVDFRCSCTNTTNSSNNLLSLLRNIFLRLINIFTK